MDPNNIPFARSMPLRARMEPASGPMDPADQQGDQTGVSQRMMVPGMQMGVAQQGPRMPSLPANGQQYMQSYPQQGFPTGAQPAMSAIAAMSAGGAEVTLKAENILLEEFEHASAAAYQAKDSTASLLNLYLLATAALATGGGVLLSSYSASNRLTVTLVIAVVLAISSILSFGFFVRLLDLARDYRDNLITMNLIKEFYIQRIGPRLPELPAAFYKRLVDVPRSRALGFGMATLNITVALLTSLAVAGAVGQARQLWAVYTSTFAPYSPEVTIGGAGLPYFWELLGAALTLLVLYVYFLSATQQRMFRRPAPQS
jgi:hypothetical protein